MKPVTLPPGRARLSTKPPPTGSAATGNTIGTLCVACSNGLTVEEPWARMTSGASVANSAACRRWPWPSACRPAHYGRYSNPISAAPAGTPRRRPEIVHHLRLRAGSRRCAEAPWPEMTAHRALASPSAAVHRFRQPSPRPPPTPSSASCARGTTKPPSVWQKAAHRSSSLSPHINFECRLVLQHRLGCPF